MQMVSERISISILLYLGMLGLSFLRIRSRRRQKLALLVLLYMAIAFVALTGTVGACVLGATLILFRVLNHHRKAKEKRRRALLKNGLCVQCGYDMKATPARCPECGRASQYRLLIHNDDVHTFEFVIESIQKVVGSSNAAAFRNASEIHKIGISIITVGSRDHVANLCKAFQSLGLKASSRSEYGGDAEEYVPNPEAVQATAAPEFQKAISVNSPS